MRKALIIGVTGQDGAYLAKNLLEKNYSIIGVTRDNRIENLKNLEKLKIADGIRLNKIDINNYNKISKLISEENPDEIYNLSGQSSVAASFENPYQTYESIILGNLNLLETIKNNNINAKYYSAGSSECYGILKEKKIDENTAFNPKSPYGISKVATFYMVKNYRELYGLNACTGILFNHESPLRNEKFVTQKIIRAACRIRNGSEEKLVLGNINVERDWGWAPEYVDLMWRMLNTDIQKDYIIATGKKHKLSEFIELAFEILSLDWKKYVQIDKKNFRPIDSEYGDVDSTLIKKELNWKPKESLKTIVEKMIEAEITQKY